MNGRMVIVMVWAGIFSAGFFPAAGRAAAASQSQAVAQDDLAAEQWLAEGDDYLAAPEDEGVADPLEPVNRLFFEFNDRLYFWLLKPVARVHAFVLPKDVRLCLRNFFHNLLMPVRLVNNLCQGKIKDSGTEVARFVINSTAGVAGLADPARKEFGLRPTDEDFGQTLGVYGLGEGLYLNWPILGPSNIRDTIGLVGDTFLDPLNYLTADSVAAAVGVYAGKRINQTSLTLGDYESFKETSLDPYVAVRDAYHQYRRGKIRDEASRPTESMYEP